MPTAPFQVSVDANDPVALGRFWNLVLPSYVPQPPPDGHESWEAFVESVGLPADEATCMYALVDPDGVAPRFLFQEVPEGKTAKNRFHLDVPVTGADGGDATMDEVRARAAELVEAGATLVGERRDEFSAWIVLLDPEGNELCVQ